MIARDDMSRHFKHTLCHGYANNNRRCCSYARQRFPAGGQFDSSQGVGVDVLVPNYLKAGAGGTGILPIMMSSFVKFMRAEYELMLNASPANARVQLDLAAVLGDMRVPPGNMLEPLHGDRKGQWSIRINDRFRICFRWTADGPEDVEIVDYH